MGKIVFIGDSVTFGVRPGVAEADTFAQKIGTARGFSEIINAGVPGDTSSGGLSRYGTDVLAQIPDAVCIMFGINDVWAGISASTYTSNILAMVQQAKAAGIRPTLLTPNLVRGTSYINAFPPYLDALRTVAVSEGIPLVDCYLRFEDVYFLYPTAQFDALWTDYQHPAAPGHQLITDLVLQPYNSAACA